MGNLVELADHALVTQLAHVEDDIGAIPAFLPAAEGPQLLNGARSAGAGSEYRRRAEDPPLIFGCQIRRGRSGTQCAGFEHGTR